MRRGQDTPGLALAVRLYRVLLLALPKELRRVYGKDAVDVFRDLYRAEYRRRGVRGVLGVGRRAITQTLFGGLMERNDRDRHHRRIAAAQGRSSSRFFATMDSMINDVRYAGRMFRRDPGFSVTAALIIATGIGATTAVFTVVDGVLLKRLPYPEPHRLVFFDNGNHPVPDYRDWVEQNTSFAELGATMTQTRNLTNEGPPLQIVVSEATPSFLPMLGARPWMGRLFTDRDGVGAPTVAVLSYDFWQRRWAGDTTIVGRVLEIDDLHVEVVGVVSRGFVPPGRVVRRAPDVWTPLDVTFPEYQHRGMWVLGVLARLEPGMTPEIAQPEMDAWAKATADAFPETHRRQDGYHTVPLIPLHKALVENVRGRLFMLLGAVGLMLFIACANVANLFLARGADREREIALRAALGASRRRIGMQLLTESVLLAVVGGAVGVGMAMLGVQAFGTLSADLVPRSEAIAIDPRVILFAVGIATGTGIIFGLAPALYAMRTNVNDALKEGTSKSSASEARLKLKNGLVVGEIALALMLVTGAGLLFNSLVHLLRVDTGFYADDVFTMPLSLGSTIEDEEQRWQFVDELTQRLALIPGVFRATAAVNVPFSMRGRCCWFTTVRNVGSGAEDSLRTVIHPVMPGYFDVLGVPLVSGRDFDSRDRDGERTPVILTRRVAERLFPTEDVLGRTIALGRSRSELLVIGVVNDLKHWSLSRDDDHDIYVPYRGNGEGFPFFVAAVRAGPNIEGMADAMRQTVWSIDAKLPVPEIVPLPQRIHDSIADTRFLTGLLVTFAAVAILFATAGVYATILYSVSARHREFGIRIALGADRRRLIRMVVSHGAKLAAAGVGLGVVGAYATSRVLDSLVFGVSTTDPMTFGLVALLLGTVGIAAAYVPASRAARADPMVSLRD